MNNTPTKMTVNAVAIWNEREQKWDVNIMTTYDGVALDCPISTCEVSKQIVAECDELVFPIAMLQHSGLDIDVIRKTK